MLICALKKSLKILDSPNFLHNAIAPNLMIFLGHALRSLRETEFGYASGSIRRRTDPESTEVRGHDERAEADATGLPLAHSLRRSVQHVHAAVTARVGSSRPASLLQSKFPFERLFIFLLILFSKNELTIFVRVKCIASFKFYSWQ